MRAIPTGPCLALIHEFEGWRGEFEPRRNYDPSGNPEIGWSHKLTGPSDPLWFAVIDQDQADALALEDLTKSANGVCTALGVSIDRLTDGQYAACIDLAYEIGVGAFTASTLAHLVKQGSLDAAEAQFPLWVHERINGIEQVSSGMVRRRQAELVYWNAKP
jgi:lysozyme